MDWKSCESMTNVEIGNKGTIEQFLGELLARIVSEIKNELLSIV